MDLRTSRIENFPLELYSYYWIFGMGIQANLLHTHTYRKNAFDDVLAKQILYIGFAYIYYSRKIYSIFRIFEFLK